MRSEAGLLRVPIDLGDRARIVACGLEQRQHARLTDALRGRVSVTVAPTFEDLDQLLRGSIEPVDIVILRSGDAAGRSAERMVRRIAKERPRVAIVAYCPPITQHSTDLRALAAAGVHQFIIAGISDEGAALREALARARRHCSAEWLMRQIAPAIPSRLHPVAEAILSHPETMVSIAALADELRVHRKTLFNWCERTGFLSPAQLLAWCRLLLVAYHLDNTGCTIETIGIELGYPSANTLRNTIKRYTGLTASELRHRGAVDAVVAALHRQRSP